MSLLKKIERSLDQPGVIDHESALQLETLPDPELFDLFALTRRLRRQASQHRVMLCSIVNAKSGACSEDCRFCAQSARYQTGAKVYGLMEKEQILAAAQDARSGGVREFSIVTSGKGVSAAPEVELMAEAFTGIRDLGLHPCASPGIVSDQTLTRWKHAGLERYHHNLETARSFFREVCTTHDYEEDIDMIRRAQARGLPVCSGGIFGMGESWAQRVELAETLRDLEVDSVPLNFFDPIAGTPLARTAPGISALEALRTIALFRLLLPGKRIILCGGRPKNLRDLQALVFDAGANALMVGNYLTTLGRDVQADRQMIRDLALEIAAP